MVQQERQEQTQHVQVRSTHDTHNGNLDGLAVAPTVDTRVHWVMYSHQDFLFLLALHIKFNNTWTEELGKAIRYLSVT